MEVPKLKPLTTVIVSTVLVFGITGTGASMLTLAGSDSAPASGTGSPACAGPLIVTHPISSGDGHHIGHVTVLGDMTLCGGQTMLLVVPLSGTPSMAYAVYQFPTEGASSVTLTFDALTGDFRDTVPTPVGGTLTPTGSRIEPVKAKDFGMAELTIGQTWA